MEKTHWPEWAPRRPTSTPIHRRKAVIGILLPGSGRSPQAGACPVLPFGPSPTEWRVTKCSRPSNRRLNGKSSAFASAQISVNVGQQLAGTSRSVTKFYERQLRHSTNECFVPRSDARTSKSIRHFLATSLGEHPPEQNVVCKDAEHEPEANPQSSQPLQQDWSRPRSSNA